MALISVSALPQAWVFDPERTALLVIDMQRDFMNPGGFGEMLGNNVSQLCEIIPTTVNLLKLARNQGWLVIHTKESHLPDLSDCPASKLGRCHPLARIGDQGSMGRILIRGEFGNDFLDAVAPTADETVICKPGKSAFYRTQLDDELRARNINYLIFAGVTTDVCVQTTMRDANDRGYDCLLIEDATSSYYPEFKTATLAMIISQNAIVGWTTKFEVLERTCSKALKISHDVEH